jgi:hypothetical protein
MYQGFRLLFGATFCDKKNDDAGNTYKNAGAANT